MVLEYSFSLILQTTGQPVTVLAYNGDNATCYQTKYSIHKSSGHGGSYPATDYLPGSNVILTVNDWCMMVSVMAYGESAHGWSMNGNGHDGPRNDDDYPNAAFKQDVHVNVWIK